MYSIFYRIIQKILLKRSFYDDFLRILETENVNQIVEVGCADSIILKKLNKDLYYDGFDVVENFIKKSKKKYLKNTKYNFENKSIHEINFKKYNSKKTIILLIGVFHHVSDDYTKIFLKKTKSFKVYAIDAVRLSDQKFFTKILMDFDKGKYIRSEDRYKNLLDGYKFILARNKYLNFDYDHLISVKNLKTDKIREILKI
tara:strand:+ start:1777 stop:2376 length:600 start_codon:yes stop_codon:yes gene_type:complete